MEVKYKVDNKHTFVLLWMGKIDRSIGTRIRSPTAPVHLGRKRPALSAPLLVFPVISRGAPRQMTWETSISERWNYGREMAYQI
jgi:hypothetical protein